MISNYGKYYDKHYENFIVHTIGALEFVNHKGESQYYPNSSSGYTMEQIKIPEGQDGPFSNTCNVECVDESYVMEPEELENSKNHKCKGKPGPPGPQGEGEKGDDGIDAVDIKVYPKICNTESNCYTRPTIWKPNTIQQASEYGLNNDSFNLIKHSFGEFRNKDVNFLDNIYFFQSDNPKRNMEFSSRPSRGEHLTEYVIGRDGGGVQPWAPPRTHITREELNKFINLTNYINQNNDATNTSPWGNNIYAHCSISAGDARVLFREKKWYEGRGLKLADKLDYCPDGFINIHIGVLTYCIPLQYISFNENEPDMVMAYYSEGTEKRDCEDSNQTAKYILPPCRKWGWGGRQPGWDGGSVGGLSRGAASFLNLPQSNITKAQYYIQGVFSEQSTQKSEIFKYFWIPHDCKLYIEYNIGFENKGYIILEGVEHTSNTFTTTEKKLAQKTMEEWWDEVSEPAKTQYATFANEFRKGTPTHTYKDLWSTSQYYTNYTNRMNHKFIVMHKSYTNDHGL